MAAKRRSAKRKSRDVPTPVVYATFGRKLRAWRRKRNLPLKFLAHDLGVSVSVISQWERAQRFPSMRNLEKISEYLDVAVCYLFCQREKGCPYEAQLDA